ncbi:hypothetical protein KIW84_042997 [Lathyrus oleraceus]|uniref:Uncharacterized protein n=1 Tax=Pisum sativum TaxID=3888 RepID=A0A9D5ATC3_PEA|nr:hypothetical protein KIW84_042997 [Pisum sativum]
MALVLAVQHWRPYLLGRKFVVYSDQKSLRHLLQQRITTADQQNWIAKLLGYHFEVVYKPGPENKAADALSRMHEEVELKGIMSFPVCMQEQQIQHEVRNDPYLKKVMADLHVNPTSQPGFQLIKGRLFYHGRLVLSAESKCIPLMLQEFHSSSTGGHSGFLRTYRRLAGNLYWVGMRKSVQTFVQSCDVCQRQKYSASSPMGTTPFEAVYGRKPPTVVRFLQGETKVEAVATELVDRDEALRQLKYHLTRAQEKMKRYADKKRKAYSFEVGEWVFLKLRPHRQQTISRRINQKLAPRYFGPFPIQKKIGAVSYKLKLPEGSRVHAVFHISQLKKAIGEYAVEPQLPEGLEIEPEHLEDPEELLASRPITKNGQRVRQCLEDKAVVPGEGNDRTTTIGHVTNERPNPAVWRVYVRRGKKVGDNSVSDVAKGIPDS